MEADAVASTLRQKDIIPDECFDQITDAGSNSRRQRNEILHDRLVRNCTREALIKACEIFSAAKKHQNMKALGDAMMMRLRHIS